MDARREWLISIAGERFVNDHGEDLASGLIWLALTESKRVQRTPAYAFDRIRSELKRTGRVSYLPREDR